MLKSTISYNDYLKNQENIFQLISKKHKKNIADTGYSLINVLLEYANINIDNISTIGIMHGLFIGLSDDWWKNSEASYKYFVNFFVHNESDLFRLQNIFNDHKKYILISHPLHYIIKNYKNSLSFKNSGSVLFVPHNIGKESLTISVDYLVNIIQSLDEKYLPIDICLHPNDINEIIVNKFTNYNFKVVTCGARNDPQFLHNFYWMCVTKKYSINLEFGSTVILSSLIGLEIFYLKSIPIIRYWPINNLAFQITPEKQYFKILKGFYNNSLAQEDFYNESFKITGGKYFIESNDLHTIFVDSIQNQYRFNKKTILPIIIFKNFYKIYIIYKNYHNALLIRILGIRGKKYPINENILLDLINHKESFTKHD